MIQSCKILGFGVVSHNPRANAETDLEAAGYIYTLEQHRTPSCSETAASVLCKDAVVGLSIS